MCSIIPPAAYFLCLDVSLELLLNRLLYLHAQNSVCRVRRYVTARSHAGQNHHVHYGASRKHIQSRPNAPRINGKSGRFLLMAPRDCPSARRRNIRYWTEPRLISRAAFWPTNRAALTLASATLPPLSDCPRLENTSRQPQSPPSATSSSSPFCQAANSFQLSNPRMNILC